MKKHLERIGIATFIFLGMIAAAQAFSLFPFQLGFMKGNVRYEDLTVSATFSPLSSYTFANTTTGKNRVSSFRVTNGGNDTLQNYSTSATGASFSKYSSPSGNITAGNYADVKFRFAPATAGAFDGAILWSAPNMTSKTFHLHGTGVCLAPSQTTGVSAGSETSSGFTVSWTPGANSTSSSLEYGTTTSYGTTINPATSPQAITGLSASTLYHYRVNAINSCSTTNGVDGTDTTAAACADSSCTGFLFCQNLETPSTGFDNGETWTTTGSGVYPAYATNALRGTQSIYFNDGTSTAKHSIAPSTEIYGHILVKFSDGQPDNSPRLLTIADSSSGNNVTAISLATNGYLRVGGVTSSLNQLPNGATGTYHIWYHWKTGSGSNGIMEVSINQTATRPGVYDLSVTNGAWTFTATYIILGLDNPGVNVWEDQLLGRSSQIDEVCQ